VRRDPPCAACGGDTNGAFYELNFGALLDEGDGRARMADSTELPAHVFLSVSAHDHAVQNGDASDRDPPPPGRHAVDLDDGLTHGANQAWGLFCSKDCLKSWLAARIDTLRDLRR